jgi:hypothetical protein
MPRWISHLLIGSYLAALGFGLFAHAFTFLKTSHPAMYFVVWDMYCGWSAYEQRYHILGEGESGTYYELAPGPWGDFSAFGSCGRHHYDVFGQFAQRIADNTLAHTEHEPILRVLLVEEAWPKKYNLPDELWALQHAGPKEPHSYFHLRSIYAPDGRCLHRGADFLARQYELAVMSNPRLRSDMRKGHTIFATGPSDPSASQVVPASWETAEK